MGYSYWNMGFGYLSNTEWTGCNWSCLDSRTQQCCHDDMIWAKQPKTRLHIYFILHLSTLLFHVYDLSAATFWSLYGLIMNQTPYGQTLSLSSLVGFFSPSVAAVEGQQMKCLNIFCRLSASPDHFTRLLWLPFFSFNDTDVSVFISFLDRMNHSVSRQTHICINLWDLSFSHFSCLLLWPLY